MRRLFPLHLCVLLLAACDDTPTSVLLTVEAETGVAPPERLVLVVYDDEGVATTATLRACDAPSCPGPVELPDDVVLYPRQDRGILRIHVVGLGPSTAVGEGATRVELRAGEQVRATVTLQAGRLPDRDGDGVPDEVDSCPDLPNPQQGACSPADAGPDLERDAGIPDGPPGDGTRRDTLPPPDTLPPLDTLSPDTLSPDTLPPCTCPLGCKPSSATCREIVPSGGFTGLFFVYPLFVMGDVTLDTTACAVSAGGVKITGSVKTVGGVQACVMSVASVNITSGGKLAVAGDNPLVLLVKNDVTIKGLVDAGAKGATPGPGGSNGGVTPLGGPGQAGDGDGGGQVCGCSGTGSDDCGGGGGGHGTPGAAGGDEAAGCATSSAGGQVYGAAELAPLVGGSGGASGGQETASGPAGAGGAGGGALQITCGKTITVDGAINVGGGGGLASTGTTTSGAGSAPGGGGGSGGGLLLEAAVITGSGIVAANGGGGAGGSAIAGMGADGADATASQTAAVGGTTGDSNSGPGGAGAVGATPAQPGGTAPNAGGGGGGGLGRIRLNWYNHGGSAPIKVSGNTSLGEVQVQ